MADLTEMANKSDRKFELYNINTYMEAIGKFIETNKYGIYIMVFII